MGRIELFTRFFDSAAPGAFHAGLACLGGFRSDQH